MSWKAEVIADSSNKFFGNGLRFKTRKEAEAYAADLAYRWTAVRQHRVVPCMESANYRWHDGRSEPLDNAT